MRNARLLVIALVLVFGAGLLAGCAKKSQQEAMTSVDSTLAMNDSMSDVPPPGPTPSEEFNPPAAGTERPQSAPRTSTPRRTYNPPPSGTTRSSVGAVTVPSGTAIALSLSTPLNTKTATDGERFTATVAEDVVMNGQVVIPAGAEVTGHVVTAQRSGKASGRAYMRLGYDELSFGGKSYQVSSLSDTIWGKGGSSKDAKLIGGGAAAGAVIGGILGGSAGSAVKGAVVGAAGGTAASLLTRGPDLDLAAGHRLTLSLDNSVRVTRPRTGA